VAFRRSTAESVAVRERIYTAPVLLLAATVGVSFLGLGFVMPLRALYGRQIGATSGEIGLMASVALLTGFLAAPGIGWLSDRFGHRTILWIGVLAHALLVLAYIPVDDPVVLIGLRGLEGIAIVSVLPPARALMNTLAPRSRQGEALALVSSAQMVGILMGPAAGTILASRVGYTPSFLLASIPLFTGAAGALLFLPGRAATPATETDGALATRAALLFTPPLLLAYGLGAVYAVTNGVIQAIWSIYMADAGASLPLIGLSYTVFALPAGLLGPIAGRLSDRRGRYQPILLGLCGYAAIYVAFGLGVSPLWLVLLSGVEGVAAAFVGGALNGLLADALPTGAHGKGQANFSAAQTAGSFVGATAAGFLYALSPRAPFVATGVVFAAGAAVLLLPAVIALFPMRAVRVRAQVG
jgi:MFS family permease